MREANEIDMRTPAEIARDKKHHAICQRYMALREAYPEYAPSRIMLKVGEEYGMTAMGIRTILQKHNILNP